MFPKYYMYIGLLKIYLHLTRFFLFLNHFCIIIFRHNTVFPFQKTDWEVAIKSINKKNLSKPHSAWKGNKNLKGMLFYSTVTY